MFRSNRKAFALLLLLCSKIISFAQTSGPSQPEVKSFQSVSISKMVEPSTGEFQYSIPLFTIGGYPININYNSRVAMENEASLVGLGFNLNGGAITRQVRGLPDDFKADQVTKKVNMKPNITTGIDIGTALELVGFDKKKAKKLGQQIGLNISSTAGLYYNNYTGYGIESRVGAGFHGNKGGLSGNAGIGINSNSQHGTSINPYCGFSYQYKSNLDKDVKLNKTHFNKYKIASCNIRTNAAASIGFDFNNASYSPRIDFPFSTVSLDFSIKAGVAGAYLEIGADIRGYRVTQELQSRTLQNPAYGFLYADNGAYIESALMDFNRENDGVMTEDKPNLPFAYATPDVYAVAGQGVGGEFELKRNNVFVGFDPKSSTNSHNAGLELEVGFGTGAHVGAELRYGYILNTSEKWNANKNKLLRNLDFMPVKNQALHNSAIAEQVYFKNPADVMFNNNPVFGITDFKPVAPALSHIPFFGGRTKKDEVNVNGQQIPIGPTSFVNQLRHNRLNVISYLTAEEASKYGVQKEIHSYTLNNLNIFFPDSYQSISRLAGNRKAHHLSELTCVTPDGKKYVFNLPAYNNIKREISFSINEATEVQNYETSHSPDLSSILNDGKGKDDFVSVTETPAYAHSFLLGCVLSPNYIDVDDNGPSVNDIGDYVKFNYAMLYKDYYWRSNNDKNKASADLGNLADNKDGKAYYTEGEKEIWYIHSIESKNEVSWFYYSDRNDAYDLKNPSRSLRRLDSILIFTRTELANANPVPFKKIYFDYNSATPLCKGIYNNAGKSKLTLNSVYFKDGTSNKGKFSGYKFEYSNFNPNYSTLEIDRWGNYKPNTIQPSDPDLDNKYFPFVNQHSRVNADKYASAWLLKKIHLPSGGIITINYEAHDYAYVQNKKAMYMAKVIGISDAEPVDLSSLSNVLYNGNSSHNYLVFKLKTNIAGTMNKSTADGIVRQEYFTDDLDPRYGNIISNGSLYGKFRVSLHPSLGFEDEDIPAFLNVVDCGAFKSAPGNNYDYGYVKLDNTNVGNTGPRDANQISKFAWQFIKHSYTKILFGIDADPDLSTKEFMDVASSLDPVTNTVKSILQTGPYRKLRNMNAASTVSANQSYIRLYVDGLKIGGNGARVKSIEILDNWQSMAGAPAANSSYTINYEYKKTVNNKTISSGVASYEPEMGGEENPWKQPIFYRDKNLLMPDDNNFMMTPYGESLFPSASIIYSEVKTTQNPVTSSNQVGAGYAKNEYYTYFDFPCRVSNTKIELVRDPKVNFKLLKNISNDYMVSAQGYVVITNDMHGKPKSESSYGENGNLVSAKYYKYKTKNNNELDNRVNAANNAGSVTKNLLGVETQVYADSRHFHTESYSGSVHGNVDIQTYGPVPTLVPSVWPDFAYEKKTFASSTINKHIRQSGILDSVIVIEKGSVVYTKNLMWDERTGDVLLTSTINEFKDSLYSFTYPAHWAYSGMGMASDNISAEITIGSAPLSDFTSKLQLGDIIAANGRKYVVHSTSPLTITSLYLPNSSLVLNTNTRLKVISSGKRNLATTSIGNFVSMANPVQGSTLAINAGTKIIDANITEFTNISQAKCDICEVQGRPKTYLLNSIRNLTPWQTLVTYKFVEGRRQANINSNLRIDGAISGFTPFWITNTWAKTTDLRWQFTQKTSIIDHKARPIEAVNPLNIFSSTQPSNFPGLVNATTINSRYHENLYDGFEDVELACSANHYAVANDKSLLDNTTSHTGYYSLKTGTNGYLRSYLYDPLTIKLETENNTGCQNRLTLMPGKKYILSAWVKEQNAVYTTLDYNNANIIVSFNAALNYTCKPTGNIIDGWQRIQQEFTAPPGNTSFTLKFSSETNFDDVRIFPANGNMKSYTYSYMDYSLMAILDENNFATFYEYDNEKQLKRVKRETEKGIVTLQEVNFGSHKK